MDSRTRFFEAMSENKRYAARMALQQRRLNKEQKMMLSRVWHQKELLMDDYILINVRTPSPARPASSPFGSSVVRPASSSMSSGPGVSRSLTSVSRVPPGDREHAFTRRMNSEGKTKGDDAERGRRSEAGRRGGRLSDVNGNVTSNCAESHCDPPRSGLTVHGQCGVQWHKSAAGLTRSHAERMMCLDP
ncbi:hypothetical protein BaRGS_00028372 [Batillaria attramentaria]|uniref:Uncharacterized protein n=1 Tax=Batillaria attramentaria TaxID=370345 RepID=A0ABD0K0G6_9CAEN